MKKLISAVILLFSQMGFAQTEILPSVSMNSGENRAEDPRYLELKEKFASSSEPLASIPLQFHGVYETTCVSGDGQQTRASLFIGNMRRNHDSVYGKHQNAYISSRSVLQSALLNPYFAGELIHMRDITEGTFGDADPGYALNMIATSGFYEAGPFTTYYSNLDFANALSLGLHSWPFYDDAEGNQYPYAQFDGNRFVTSVSWLKKGVENKVPVYENIYTTKAFKVMNDYQFVSEYVLDDRRETAYCLSSKMTRSFYERSYGKVAPLNEVFNELKKSLSLRNVNKTDFLEGSFKGTFIGSNAKGELVIGLLDSSASHGSIVLLDCKTNNLNVSSCETTADRVAKDLATGRYPLNIVAPLAGKKWIRGKWLNDTNGEVEFESGASDGNYGRTVIAATDHGLFRLRLDMGNTEVISQEEVPLFAGKAVQDYVSWSTYTTISTYQVCALLPVTKELLCAVSGWERSPTDGKWDKKWVSKNYGAFPKEATTLEKVLFSWEDGSSRSKKIYKVCAKDNNDKRLNCKGPIAEPFGI